ncbi:MAG: ribulose-phosphate 3-epimerase [Mangrovibacterium sp.]
MTKRLVSPSILAANFLELGKEIEMLNASEADYIHCDVMDGVFVPNISFGLPIIQHVHHIATKPLDVHLMIENPDIYIEDFQKAGAAMLTVHEETCRHLHRTVHKIKECGMKAGVCLNPHTPVSTLEEIIPYANCIMLMTVNPGFGGQKFIESSYEKVRKLRKMVDALNPNCLIEVDGGVNFETGKLLYEAGVDMLVAGSFVFNSKDSIATIKGLKEIC